MECETDRTIPYAKGEYNKFNDEEQWIRISEGCPNKCAFCRESWENPKLIMLEIPEIVRNKVKIMDMNLLCKKNALHIIEKLGEERVEGRVIYYNLK